MNIEESKKILETQLALKRTSKGRPLNDYALESLKSSLEDVKNYKSDASQCLNCGLVQSILLMHESCPNCGGLDIALEIE
jgi:rubrerythrin